VVYCDHASIVYRYVDMAPQSWTYAPTHGRTDAQIIITHNKSDYSLNEKNVFTISFEPYFVNSRIC